jgi:hypothetical protein
MGAKRPPSTAFTCNARDWIDVSVLECTMSFEVQMLHPNSADPLGRSVRSWDEVGGMGGMWGARGG